MVALTNQRFKILTCKCSCIARPYSVVRQSGGRTVGGLVTGTLPVGGLVTGTLPVGGLGTGTLFVGGLGTGTLFVGGLGAGPLPIGGLDGRALTPKKLRYTKPRSVQSKVEVFIVLMMYSPARC